jgi:hypothetical protein
MDINLRFLRNNLRVHTQHSAKMEGGKEKRTCVKNFLGTANVRVMKDCVPTVEEFCDLDTPVVVAVE